MQLCSALVLCFVTLYLGIQRMSFSLVKSIGQIETTFKIRKRIIHNQRCVSEASTKRRLKKRDAYKRNAWA